MKWILALALSSLSAHAATYDYTNKVGKGKTLHLTVTVNRDSHSPALPSTCDHEMPESYNDYTNTWEPAYTAHLPCIRFRFENLIELKGTLTDDATGESETTVIQEPWDFHTEYNQSIGLDVLLYHWAVWDIQFPKQGYGIRVGNSTRELPMHLMLAADGKFELPLNFNEILAQSRGFEPFWCAAYDGQATGAWYELTTGGDPLNSPYRNARVCGTFQF